MDYTSFTADILGVIANGTAVLIEPLDKQTNVHSYYTYQITDYNNSIPISPYAATISMRKASRQITIKSINHSGHNITAMNMDISLVTVFDDSISFKDISFVKIDTDNNKILTEYAAIPIPDDFLRVVKSIGIHINKYIEDGRLIQNNCPNLVSSIPIEELNSLRQRYGFDIVENFNDRGDEWTCYCGSINLGDTCSKCKRSRNSPINSGSDEIIMESLLLKMNQLSSAREIYSYLKEHNPLNDNILSENLLQAASKYTGLERMYGNMKRDCIEAIENLAK